VKSQRNERIESLIRLNLQGDLIAQFFTLLLCIWWLRSPWMWTIWCLRWVVVIAITIALHMIRSGRHATALRWLLAGHIIGVYGLVAIVPVLTPLALLILVGDLFLATYLDEPARTRFFSILVVAVTGVATLRFQNWTHLSELASPTVALFAIISNTFASAIIVPRTHRQHYNQLCELRDRLGAIEQRLSVAIAAERLAVARALRNEPIAHLQRLAGQLGLIRQTRIAHVATAVSIADQAATDAQEALRSLRAISHGVFPELLQFGLPNAVQPLLRDVGTVEQLEIPTTRFAPATEAAIYVALREWSTLCQGEDSRLSVVLEPTSENLHLRIQLSNEAGLPTDELSPLATDRIAAIGGESTFHLDTTHAWFEALIPTTNTNMFSTLDETDAIGEEGSTTEVFDANRRILGPFVRWAFGMAAIAQVCSIGVLVVTRTASAVLVAAAMAWLTLGIAAIDSCIRRSRYGVSVVLICIVSSTSAILLTTLLPELTPAMALIVSFPAILSLPHFSQRILNLVVVVQASVLTAISVIGYLDRPLVKTVVPSAFPTIVVPVASACVATMIAFTMTDTVGAVMDGSYRMQRALRRTVHEADAHRQTIERDLHDGAQQMFVAISLQFRTLSRLLQTDSDRAESVMSTVADLIQSATDSLYSVARGTLVPELDSGRLGDALRAATASAGCPADLTIENGEDVVPEVARVVYFCCHEAMQNAVKHGGEGVAVSVSVRSDTTGTFFSVTDTGQGFDPQQLPQTGGLQSLMRRINTAGGTLRVESNFGKGTTIVGSLPNGKSVN
jgi:signal transduction histidine kinase